MSVCLYVNHNSNSVIETRKCNIIYINMHSFIKRCLLLAEFTGFAVYQQQFLKDYPNLMKKKLWEGIQIRWQISKSTWRTPRSGEEPQPKPIVPMNSDP